MKKLFISIAILSLTLLVRAQTSPVDAMFDKYSEKQGFTVVSISGKMLSMFANLDSENKDAGNTISRLKSIRILSVEDSTLNKNLNFYSELSRKLDLSAYEELMLVKEGPDITKFMVHQTGDIVTELLMISGGPGGNTLISIRGEIDLKNISNLSKQVGIEDLNKLEKMEDKPAKSKTK
jgi:hypothetical protein